MIKTSPKPEVIGKDLNMPPKPHGQLTPLEPLDNLWLIKIKQINIKNGSIQYPERPICC